MLFNGNQSERREDHTCKEDMFDDLKDSNTADSIIEDDRSEIG